MDHSSALELDPNSAENLVGRSDALVDHPYPQLDRALSDLNAALRLKPDDAGIYLRRSLVHSLRYDFEAAISDAKKAFTLAPTVPNAKQVLQELEAEKAELEEAKAAAEGKAGASDELICDSDHIDERLVVAAIADFTKIIDLDPREPEGYEWRADAYWFADEPDKALADYSKAIELNPSKGPFHARGLIYQEMGRHELAVADFTKALEARPRSSASYEQRGVSLKALGQTARAIADLEKALELEPDSEPAKKELAELRDAKVSNQPSKETGKTQELVVAKAASGHKVEITFWNSVKASNDKAMLEAYLERFPNGAFAPLAKIKLKKLGAD